MRFEALRVVNVRCLVDVSIKPAPGLNVFVGDNGAGKTSLLEAISLLSRGRSFRRGARDALMRRDADHLQVYGEIRDASGRLCRLGLGRQAGAWDIRLDGNPIERISDLLRHCAVVSFDPESHALISGAAEERRRFLDWGVFHVEHTFLDAWQRYQRALRQRNTLLRGIKCADARLFAPWEEEMTVTAQVVDRARQRYLSLLEPHLRDVCGRTLPELGQAMLVYRQGWNHATSLAECLVAQRERDFARGFTSAGIHRADWRLAFAGAPQREFLSRGQEKLCALACLLAQARVYADSNDEWPIFCLDDLGSELDGTHLADVVAQLHAAGAQAFITGTEASAVFSSTNNGMFHVEHGVVTPRA
ncbi:MAG TPA: DNA replication/repair protein RecF [Rhodanobacteraceae bacterium]